MVRHMATTPERLAAELRAEMARQRRTLTWLADQVGMTQSTLGRKLRGEYPFDVTELDMVTAALGIRASELWSRIDTEVA